MYIRNNQDYIAYVKYRPLVLLSDIFQYLVFWFVNFIAKRVYMHHTV